MVKGRTNASEADPREGACKKRRHGPGKGGQSRAKDTVKRRREGRGKENSQDRRGEMLPKMLKKEMQSIQENLSKMETKFARKIEGLEKKRQIRRSAAKKKKQSKGSKQRRKGSAQRTLGECQTRELFLTSPGQFDSQKLSPATRLLPFTPFPASQIPLQESVTRGVTKKVMDQVETLVERRFRENAAQMREAMEINTQKIVRKLEK